MFKKINLFLVVLAFLAFLFSCNPPHAPEPGESEGEGAGFRVFALFPVNGSSSVGVDSDISIIFSAPVNSETFTVGIEETLQISKDDFVTSVDGVMIASTDYSSFVFKPLAPLEYNTLYKVKITTAVTSLAGESLNGDYEASFTTKDYRQILNYFRESQSIPTYGAIDAEYFEIDGESYMAVANYRDDEDHDALSEVLKWNGTDFVGFQNLAYSNQAHNVEFFTIGNNHFLAVANYSLNASSPIYLWNGQEFVVFKYLSSSKGHDFEFFQIGSRFFLAMADINGSGKLFEWNNNTFEEIDILASDLRKLKFFTSEGSFYLAGTASEAPRISIIYKWNGSTMSENTVAADFAGGLMVEFDIFTIDGTVYFAVPDADDTFTRIFTWENETLTERQTFSSNSGYCFKYYSVGRDHYLALINSNVQPDNDSSTWSQVYKWNGAFFQSFQSIQTSKAREWEVFTMNNTPYLFAMNFADASDNRNAYSVLYEGITTVID